MNSEEFTVVEEKLANGELPDLETVRAMVLDMKRLDTLLVIFQQGLELLADNAMQTIQELALAVQKRCGRTDQKTTKSIAEMAASAVTKNDELIQGYMMTAMFNAATFLEISIEDLLGLEPGELDVEQEADAAQPVEV
jgi:hypothetical protein